jgi:hypothetical protein
MGVPLSTETHSKNEHHHDPTTMPLATQPASSVKAPPAGHASFVGTLLHSHRCHVCGDVKVPRPFQTNCGTKVQRTCRQCNRQVCVDCYKNASLSHAPQKRGTTTSVAGLVCASCIRVPTAAVGKTAHPPTRRVITLRSLMTSSPHHHTEVNSVWTLICSYAFEESQFHRQRCGRHLFLSWCRSWASAAPMLLPCAAAAPQQHQKVAALIRSPPPPPRLHELKQQNTVSTPRRQAAAVLADDATSSDDEEGGSPVARIPDYSAALEETSGSIFCALNVNTPCNTTSIKAQQLGSGVKYAATTPQQRTAPCNSAHRVAAVSQSPFAVKGSVRRPNAHISHVQSCSSTSPLPRTSTALSARKDHLGVPATPRTVGLSPRPHDVSTPSYLRPTEGSHRRASIAWFSMSPLVSTRRSTVIASVVSTPRNTSSNAVATGQYLAPPNAQPNHLAAFGRTDTSTVSPLVFRAPRPRIANDENIAQTLFS